MSAEEDGLRVKVSVLLEENLFLEERVKQLESYLEKKSIPVIPDIKLTSTLRRIKEGTS